MLLWVGLELLFSFNRQFDFLRKDGLFFLQTVEITTADRP
jgi:hypothetical protein